MSPYRLRLIVVFLVSALVVSTAAFFPVGKKTDRSTNNATGSSDPLVPLNAFVETPPITNPAVIAANQARVAAENDYSKNLTDDLLYSLVQEIDRANPNGPITESGIAALSTPDIQKAIDGFLGEEAVREYAIPDWERSIAIENSTRLATTYTKDDLARYSRALEAIFSDYKKIEAVLSKNPNKTTGFAEAESSLRTLRERTLALSVPLPLAQLHWNFIRLVGYQEKAAAEFRTQDEDPLRSALAFHIQEDKFAEAVSSFESEFDRVAAAGTLVLTPTASPLARFFSFLVGPRIAHALFFEIVKDIIRVARFVWTVAKTSKTEILKQMLIQRITKQTVSWLQGGGKPQFITDWKGYLAKRTNQAVGNALTRIEPGLCAPFADSVREMFAPEDYGGLNVGRGGPVQCTLTDVVKNVDRFAKDFRQGGWDAYITLLDPNNNFYGTLLSANDYLQNKAAQEKKAQTLQNKTAEGFTSGEECVKTERRYVDGVLKDVCVQSAVTTPGHLIARSVYQALDAPLQRIVNADDIVGLIAILTDAALTKLTQLGKTGLNKGLANLRLGPGDPSETPPGSCAPDSWGCIVNTPEQNCTNATQANAYRGTVTNKVNQIVAADQAAHPQNDGLFNHSLSSYDQPKLNDGMNVDFLEALCVALRNDGFLCVHNGDDQITIRRESDNFDEGYDVIKSDGFLRAPFHVATCIPPADTGPGPGGIPSECSAGTATQGTPRYGADVLASLQGALSSNPSLADMAQPCEDDTPAIALVAATINNLRGRGYNVGTAVNCNGVHHPEESIIVWRGGDTTGEYYDLWSGYKSCDGRTFRQMSQALYVEHSNLERARQ